MAKAKRKLPPRYKSGPKKGQFKPKSARRNPSSKRKTTTRKRRTTRKNPGRTVRAKSNPPQLFGGDVLATFMDAGVEAGQILVGKAAARTIPDLIGAPKQGNIGLAVQGATALAMGWLASMFLSENAARAITAGGLTAPLETLVVASDVPWMGRALAPVTANADLGAYVRAAPPMIGPPNGSDAAVAGYVRRRRASVGGYASRK